MKKTSNNGTLSRRRFMSDFLAGSAVLAIGGKAWAKAGNSVSMRQDKKLIELPPLPYAMQALEPHISARTLSFHYGKHHQGYINNTNAIVNKEGLWGKSLTELIREAAGKADTVALFNNAAQAWNHGFYWQSLTPKGGGEPRGKLGEAIHAEFGGYEAFKQKFIAAASSRFGSGWSWLVHDDRKLKIVTTANADTPLIHGQTPLLVVDVWEHAYYLDYQNGRKKYLAAVMDQLINWRFAESNLQG